ncbi:MAG: tetratricopeptide repeat protein [Deltaproteobacteria bacterium]|uniref:Tetratricopeptide repeat protein n=1 Tax=Candidatus Desulfacyla euxinica TaxID=2841693 RepID=A0A8J6T4H7_9DELT|nr:tetratricopeptide repeat protein [Candidatus Desulfacyla euxinica]
MSYIHQALKKAQVERDDRYGKYGGIISSRSKKSGLGKKSILLIIVSLAILFLAFMSYSWLDFSGPQVETNIVPKKRGPVQRPVHEKTSDAMELYERGKEDHKGGRLNRAKMWYEKALIADPGYVVALNNLGVLLIKDENYPAARSRFEKAIRLKPGYVDPYYNLVCLFALTDRPEQALRYLKRAVAIHPEVKTWALEDADLGKLHNLAGFKGIVDR